MRVQVLQEINSKRGIIKPGEIINIEESLLAKLEGKVKPVTDGKDLPHYCQPADCWCSVKTGKNYPDGCTTYKCEYQGRQS